MSEKELRGETDNPILDFIVRTRSYWLLTGELSASAISVYEEILGVPYDTLLYLLDSGFEPHEMFELLKEEDMQAVIKACDDIRVVFSSYFKHLLEDQHDTKEQGELFV